MIHPALRPIGWMEPGSPWPFSVVGADGVDRVDELFAVRAGAIVPRRPLVPIMVTMDARIAEQDCLFYTVARSSQESRSRLPSSSFELRAT